MTQAKTKPKIKKKANTRSSTSATTKTQPLAVEDTNQELIKSLELALALARGVKSEGRAKSESEQNVIETLRQRLGDTSCILQVSVQLWGRDKELFHVTGLHELHSILKESALSQAPQRFNYTIHDSIMGPLSSDFMDLVNSLHNKEHISDNLRDDMDAVRDDRDLPDVRSVDNSTPSVITGGLSGIDD